MASYLDRMPMDFGNRAVREIRDYLAAIYYRADQVIVILQDIGVSPASINWSQPMKLAWSDVLRTVQQQGKLNTLLRYLTEGSDQAAAARVRELLAALPETAAGAPDGHDITDPADDTGQPSPDPGTDSQCPEPPPGSLSKLADLEARLAIIVEEIAARPEILDASARDIHRGIVMRVYELMRRDVEPTFGAWWDKRARRRFYGAYSAAANKWPVYQQALAEFDLASYSRKSLISPMRRLEMPRRAYIAALSNFHAEFRVTLDFLRAR
jgi:Effector-associated domain 1